MQLNYKSFGEGFPIVILHGLFGSLDNWQSIAKQLTDISSQPSISTSQVFILDLRNHGKSEHSSEFNYQLVADDLLEFFAAQKIPRAHLIGHSMGGKAAMLFAMQHPPLVEKLVVVDVAPAPYEDRHREVFDALFAVNLEALTTRQEAEQTVRQHMNDNGTVQFLMKGLQRNDAGGFEWKFNLKALHVHYAEVSDGVEGKAFEGGTLFVKGAKSSYINSGNYHYIAALFPNHELTEIAEAGHWVHAEQPEKFVTVVRQFLGN